MGGHNNPADGELYRAVYLILMSPECYAIERMVKNLSKEQRGLVAEKMMDWGNLVFTGLVIAQFVPGAGSYHWQFIVAGLVGIIIAYAIGILLMEAKGGEHI